MEFLAKQVISILDGVEDSVPDYLKTNLDKK